jgi:hypothetical protein
MFDGQLFDIFSSLKQHIAGIESLLPPNGIQPIQA